MSDDKQNSRVDVQIIKSHLEDFFDWEGYTISMVVQVFSIFIFNFSALMVLSISLIIKNLYYIFFLVGILVVSGYIMYCFIKKARLTRSITSFFMFLAIILVLLFIKEYSAILLIFSILELVGFCLNYQISRKLDLASRRRTQRKSLLE